MNRRTLPYASVAQRLLAGLVRMPNGCLEWTKATNRNGYGLIGVKGNSRLAHRVAWELANGPIPLGMNVLHHCDNPPCCDTERCLFLGTQADNTSDMIAKGRARLGDHGRSKTHCVSGHDLSGEDVKVTPLGRRICMECRRSRARASSKADRMASPGPGSGSFQRAKTHCPQGHPYDDINTYATSNGKRACKECSRIRHRARIAAKRAQATP